MKPNDIVKRKEQDIFFKIIEKLDDERFVVELMGSKGRKPITYIIDGEDLLFVRDEFDDYYNLPPIIVITQLTHEKMMGNFDRLMDKYENFRDTKYPQYGDIKFFKDGKDVVVYVVL